MVTIVLCAVGMRLVIGIKADGECLLNRLPSNTHVSNLSSRYVSILLLPAFLGSVMTPEEFALTFFDLIIL